MDDYYLRLEGVNLATFVYDTNDLSTIRGGGQLLLEAVNRVAEKFEFPDDSIVTKGASWGLLRSGSLSEEEAITLVENVEDFLRKDPIYRHATFVAQILPVGEEKEYRQVCDQLTAMCRHQQMSSPALAIPTPSQTPLVITRDGRSAAHFVCQVDKKRPAVDTETAKDGLKRAVSASIKIRRPHGKEDKRKGWYEKMTGSPELPYFVNDFKELSTGEENIFPDNLQQKMAVIYLDGNKFGALQRNICTSENKQKLFDQRLREIHQKGALSTLVHKITTRPHWRSIPNKHLQLETLLWGGDEITWVVPAWQGWWFLAEFFQLSRSWDIDDNILTNAAGLVFCHHNAPIKQVTDLARNLAELAKDRSRDENLLAYQVLESFDHMGTALRDIRAQRCPPSVDNDELIISGESMAEVQPVVKTIKHHMPKRQLHGLVRYLYANEVEKAQNLINEFKNDEVLKQELPKLETCFGEGCGKYIHLLELWDYIAPLDDTEEIV